MSDPTHDHTALWLARLDLLGLAPDPDERDQVAAGRARLEPGLERLRRLEGLADVEQATIDRSR